MCLPPSCDPFTGNEGFALASIALTLIPLLFFPGAAKLLAVAGPFPPKCRSDSLASTSSGFNWT